MTRYILLAMTAILFSGTLVYGQDSSTNGLRDQEIIQKLGHVVTGADVNNVSVAADMVFIRGGDEGFGFALPLGCYVCQPAREFTSKYVHESASTVVNWVYDLHVFMSKAEKPAEAPLWPLSPDLPSYRNVREFADNWWKENSQAFVHVRPMHQSAWIYEAILDGVNVWYEYKSLYGAASMSDKVEFDNAITKYQNASWHDIFF